MLGFVNGCDYSDLYTSKGGNWEGTGIEFFLELRYIKTHVYYPNYFIITAQTINIVTNMCVKISQA